MQMVVAGVEPSLPLGGQVKAVVPLMGRLDFRPIGQQDERLSPVVCRDTQASGDRVVMDFQNVRINQGVPASRFVYDPPPYANVVQDWLFDPEQ